MNQDLIAEILELGGHEANSWFDDTFVRDVAMSMEARHFISDAQKKSLMNIKEKLENSIERWESRNG